MAQEGAQLGPRPVSGIEIIFRGLSGFIGGALASILTILALAFGGPLLQNLIGDNPNHPIYFIARGFGAELLGYFVAIHWLFAILVSSIIFEVVAALETRNLLLSLYQSFFGFFVTFFFVF